MIRSGCLSCKAFFPAIAPISSTSISEILRSLTPDFSMIQSSDSPMREDMSAEVSTFGGIYNPVPLILNFKVSSKNNILIQIEYGKNLPYG